MLDPVVVGGVVCVPVDGGGGVLGTFSGGMEEVEDGVAGVFGVISGFCGSSRLWEPGKNAGSELSSEAFSLESGFEALASHRYIFLSMANPKTCELSFPYHGQKLPLPLGPCNQLSS